MQRQVKPVVLIMYMLSLEQNNTSVLFLYSLLNVCFNEGVGLSVWDKCTIYPIPKLSVNDHRDLLSYRGIPSHAQCKSYTVTF